MSGFSITGGKGFHITLTNGYTVSVQFGPGNYCDNYDMSFTDFLSGERRENLDSTTAETAIIAPDGEFVSWLGDDVQARQTVEDVLNTIAYAQTLGRATLVTPALPAPSIEI